MPTLDSSGEIPATLPVVEIRLLVQKFLDEGWQQRDIKVSSPVLIREHDLMVFVFKHLPIVFAEDVLLALFQKHYLLRNSFFMLQELDDLRYRLRPTAFGVELHASFETVEVVSGEPSGLGCATSKAIDSSDSSAELRRFYTDFKHYREANAENVAELMASFWRRFESQDDIDEALKVFELPETTVDWQIIQTRYRALAHQHHPDRGGDADQFVAVTSAYEVLKTRYGAKA